MFNQNLKGFSFVLTKKIFLFLDLNQILSEFYPVKCSKVLSV